VIITHQDMRLMKYCNKGAREFFSRHGLDWALFMAEGLPEETILATGDDMAIQLVAFVKENKNGRG